MSTWAHVRQLIRSRVVLPRPAVRNLVRAGVPERVARQMTGHKTRAVFERDNIVSPGDLRHAAQRLDAFATGAAS